jgi:hypothetical protein
MKFMTIPNYTYLKLKMQGPNGFITIGANFQQAYYYDRECMALTVVITPSTSHANSGQGAEEAALAANKARTVVSCEQVPAKPHFYQSFQNLVAHVK